MFGRTSEPRRGQILITLTLGLAFFLGLAGLAVDMIYLYIVKAQLVTAVDAAALAAARALARGNTPAEQQTQANAAVNLLFNANFPNSHLLTRSVSHANPLLEPGPTPGTRQITISAQTTAPTFFLGTFGARDVTVRAESKAIRRDVNLVLVLDRSGSMSTAPGTNPGPTAFDDLQYAANYFVDNFDNSRDRLGLAVFAGVARLDAAPATSFKTNLHSLINAHQPGGGTNIGDGLWRAYQALVTLNDPNALNVIVLFTDGYATAFTGNLRAPTALATIKRGLE